MVNVFFGLFMKYHHTSKALSIFENCKNLDYYTEDGLIVYVDTTMKIVLSSLLVTFYHGDLTRFNSNLYKLESCFSLHAILSLIFCSHFYFMLFLWVSRFHAKC